MSDPLGQIEFVARIREFENYLRSLRREDLTEDDKRALRRLRRTLVAALQGKAEPPD